MRSSAHDLAQPIAPGDRGEIDLTQLFREIGRRKWLVLLATVGSLALSTAAVNVLKPRFTAETRVFLENRDTEYTRIGGRDAAARMGENRIDQDFVNSQVQIATSRDIARTIIRKFDLGNLSEFDSTAEGMGTVTRLGVMTGLLQNPATISKEERVMNRYFDKLKVFSLSRTQVLSFEFQSRDPDLSAKLSQAIADEYILQLEQAKKGSARSAGTWLQRTIGDLRQRVADAETKVETFRAQNGLLSVGENSGTVNTQQLSELNTQLATAKQQQTDLSSRARLLREAIRQGRIFELSDVNNNEVVRRLLETRSTLTAQIAQEEQTLLPQHPRIKELRAQLGGLEGQIRAAAERAARALENDARAAGARLAAAQADLDVQKRQSGAAGEQEVQLRVLEREAKAEREQLENFLARYRDASVRDTENAFVADARIVSRATVPSIPTFPKKIPIVIVSTLAGFMLSLFWVLTRALLSDRIYSRRTPETQPAQMVHSMMPSMMTPQMMAALYAQQFGMQMPAAAAAPVAAQAAPQAASAQTAQATMADPAASVASAPQVSETRVAVAAPLDRMADLLKQPAPTVALPLPAVTSAMSAMMDDSEAYDPLVEIADEARLALVRGRPVAILVLSSVDRAFATATALKLEAALARRGSVQLVKLESTAMTPSGIQQTARAMGHVDYVVMLAGSVEAGAAALAHAAGITVLVASDDIDDKRVDRATALLDGANYFIVNAVDTTPAQVSEPA
jgi:uncharacterized protein involved in exopolysaccharide biosynthesis